MVCGNKTRIHPQNRVTGGTKVKAFRMLSKTFQFLGNAGQGNDAARKNQASLHRL
jgi:hypothetical protein